MPILFFKNFWPCWEACEVLVPWPPIEPMPLGVEAQSLNHWTSQEVQELYPFYNFFYLAALCLRCCIWDLVPQPGIEPGPPASGAQSLSHWTTKEVPYAHFKKRKLRFWEVRRLPEVTQAAGGSQGENSGLPGSEGPALSLHCATSANIWAWV